MSLTRRAVVAALAALGVRAAPVAALSYEEAIYDACSRHGCDGDLLVATMYCESGGDHGAVGPNGERGILQFHPQGDWPDAAWADPWTQIEVAAIAFANGLSCKWACVAGPSLCG